MTRSNERRIKAIKEKQEKKTAKENEELMQKMEQMGAAYSKETSLPATHIALCHEVETVKDEEKGSFKQITRYWYENHEERTKIADTHPDIQYLFSLAMDLDKAYTAKDGASVKDGFDMLTQFLQKYRDADEQGQRDPPGPEEEKGEESGTTETLVGG